MENGKSAGVGVKGWRMGRVWGGCEGVENGKSAGVGVKGWRMGRVWGWV